MMKKSLVSLAAATLLAAAPQFSFAEDAPAAPAASPLTFNLGVVTDYRYRGISQTRLNPAAQGGIDFAGPNGLYVGTWLSTIKWIKDAGGDSNVEWDVYGGWKGEVSKGLTLDVGVLGYIYNGNKLPTSANTTEIYGALSYDVYTAKYSHSVSNLFGFPDSTNSGYLDLSAGFDVGNGVTLTPHLGYQHVAHNGDFSYTDYSLTVSKDFSGWVPSLAIVGADTKTIAGTKAYASPANGKDLGKAGVVLGLKYNF
jgi:uncharacterized protein (TIGR02001 family)